MEEEQKKYGNYSIIKMRIHDLLFLIIFILWFQKTKNKTKKTKSKKMCEGSGEEKEEN